VEVAIYPQYETRGELNTAVARFREWLQNTVIDLEVAAHTPSPTVEPSVHTILVGHSMGGIVAADTLVTIIDDIPVAGDSRCPFPHIAAILAFDTPYLGLAPSVIAHSAEGKWETASSAYGTVSSVASGLFASQAAVEGAVAKKKDNNGPSQQGLFGKWGRVAAYSGAAAALAGGAAAAYVKRDDISAGFGWISSHLEFVGSLMKNEELKKRVNRASTAEGVGFANCFTSLGGDRMGTSMLFKGNERTFCSLPPDDNPLRKKFYRSVNTIAQDEVAAHCSMFEPKKNPAYYELADRARNLICMWVKEDMYPPLPEDDEFHRLSRTSGRSNSYKHEGKRRDSHEKVRHSMERASSGKSTRSGHGKEKKKKDIEDERPRGERPASTYEYEERRRLERSGSSYERELKKGKSSREKEKSSSRQNSQYQMDYDENPWR